jgi:hypothetical protein
MLRLMLSCVLLQLVLLGSCVHAKVHHVEIKQDTRPLITFEVFGFLEGGVLGVNVSSFSVHDHETGGNGASDGGSTTKQQGGARKLGFVLVRESDIKVSVSSI